MFLIFRWLVHLQLRLPSLLLGRSSRSSELCPKAHYCRWPRRCGPSYGTPSNVLYFPFVFSHIFWSRLFSFFSCWTSFHLFLVSHSLLKILTVPPGSLTHLSYFPLRFPSSALNRHFENLTRKGMACVQLKVLQHGA